MALKIASKHYRDKLDPIVKARYDEKLKLISENDPFELKNLSNDVELLPALSYPDIVFYLLFTPSVYTHDDLKNYKSLDAVNQVECGWVSDVKSVVIDKKHVVRGRVLHSQRLRDKALTPWFIAEKNGAVLASHCDCMAGCGETCTHVAALMFWVSATVKMRDERTVTQKAAYWKPPPNLKNVQYKETSRIDFTSKKNLKRKFNDMLAGTPTVTQPVSARKPKKKIPAPTTEELNDFFSALKLSGKKPAVLSLVPGFSDDYVPVVKKVHLPKLLNGLRNKDWDHLYDEEIRDKCCSIFPTICVTDEEVINCEKLTKEQSNSKLWFDLRAGRITASNMKAVCRTDESNPSKSLIKKICYPHDKFSNNATKWGTQNEKKATRQCCEVLSTSHSNLRVEMSGLHISETLSFIAASPDGFVHCDCCGVSCLEVKCPYTKKGMMIDDSVPCLQKNSNGELCLDIDHEYYYQVQTQMGVTGLESCFFVVWTDKDMFIELISFDVKFWNEATIKAEKLFKYAILPELVGKIYTRLPTPSDPHDTLTTKANALCVSSANNNMMATDDNVDPPAECYCLCNGPEEGRMICCDNENCDIGWYHFTCLKMIKRPKIKLWFCPSCQD